MVSEDVYRWLLGGLIAIGLPMSAYFRSKADRAGGRVSRREDRPLIAWALGFFGLATMGSVVAYLVNPAWMGWSQLALWDWLRLWGAPIGAAALGLFYWVFRSLGLNVTPTAQTRVDHTLVTTGPYRWVRHPMYSSGLALFGAYSLLTANWFIAAASGLAFAVIAVRTSIEEQDLIARFGDEYRAYRHRTGRFLPRLRRLPDAQNGN